MGGILRDVATVIGNWWREFGDNDLVGWATTVAYFLVAAMIPSTTPGSVRSRESTASSTTQWT